MTAVDPDEVECPANAGIAPSFDFEFINASVVHRNLNGQFCDPTRWNGIGGGAIDGSILSGGEYGITYPPVWCTDKDDAGDAIPEILYMNVGTIELEEFNFTTLPIGLRVVDISDTVSDSTTEIRNHPYTGYNCQNTYKCGNVKEGTRYNNASNGATSHSGDGKDSVFGQVQLDLKGAAMKLQFSIVYCCYGGDCCIRDDDGNCTALNIVPVGTRNCDSTGQNCEACNPKTEAGCQPNYEGFNSTNCRTVPFDAMVMTFLDIDGNNEDQEFLVGHNLYTYLFGGLPSNLTHPEAIWNPPGTTNGTYLGVRRTHLDTQDTYVDGEFTAYWDDNNPTPSFVDMDIRVYDANRVYMDRACNPNESPLGDFGCPHRWNNRTGDVTFTNANRDDVMLLDATLPNGDFPNPGGIVLYDENGDIDTVGGINEEQLKRGVQMVWVSSRIKEYAQCLNNAQGECAGEIDATDRTVCMAVEQEFCQQDFNLASMGGRNETFDVTFGTQKRTIEFAGYSEALAGPECKTCDTGFFQRGNTCPANMAIENRDRVCVYDPILLEDKCSVDYCCDPGTTPRPTSHGDPIIWTFNDECYDLNKDGLYLATSHPDFDHDVYIAVYNNYMREIQVVDRETEDILLAVNTLGEVFKSDDFKFYYAHKTLDCPDDIKETECNGQYEDFRFDAQSFRFAAMLLRHDYLDPALKEGELGYHFDIYPATYTSFEEKRDGYTGLYFENPLPEELEYCPGGSPRRQ